MTNSTKIGKSIKELHQRAETLREQDKHLQALKLYEEVIVGYQSKKDYLSLSESLLGKSLTYKHLFLKTGDFTFTYLAKHTALCATDVTSHYSLTNLYRCYFRLGDIELLFSNSKNAIIYFSQAVKNYPTNNAEKGQFIYHLGAAKLSKSLIKKGIDQIIRYHSTISDYEYHVWLSGAYLKMAEIFKDKKYLAEAEKIILSDSRLIIRKRQLAEIKKVI